MPTTKLFRSRNHVFVVLLCLFGGTCYAQEPPALASSRIVSLVQEAHTSALLDVLKDLEKRFGVIFDYNRRSLKSKQVSYREAPGTDNLDNILREILEPLDLGYQKYSEHSYLIYDKDKPVRSGASTGQTDIREEPGERLRLKVSGLMNRKARVSPEEFAVSGQVRDENNDPLPGVSILVKGTSIGTTSNESGRYTITAPDGNSVLVFSFVGYLPQEVSINNRSSLDIGLQPDVQTLSEVVVVGYGTQRRADLTGAVASVGNRDLVEMKVSRVDQALVGKMAGVQVKQASGQPGAAPQIRVRGFNSISQTNDPLIVIDGVPGGNLATLNPNDIESIDVLKDASAAAIYGSRASNGVVLVTTKRGKSGRATISYNTQFGWQSPERYLDLMNAQQAAQLQYDGFVQLNQDLGNDISGNPAQWARPVPQVVMDVLNGTNTTDTDWQRLIFRTAPMQTHQLGISGGGERMRFYLGGEYLDQDGIAIETDYKRYGLRLNLDGDVSDRLRISTTLNTAFINENNPPVAGRSVNLNALGNAMVAMPFYPAFNDDGSYFPQFNLTAGADLFHPVASLREVTSRNRNLDLTGNITAEYTLTEGLRAKILLGSFLRNQRNKFFRNASPAFPDGVVPDGSNFSSQTVNWLAEYTLSYDKTLGEKHNISAVAGYTAQRELYEQSSLSTNRFPNNLVQTLNAAGGQLTGGESFENEWSLLSLLGRVAYNYDGRYYLTATVRRDGSSRFGPENRWGWFPSAALAWRISEEAFLRDNPLLSDLKLRASYGTSGNFNIPDFAYLPTVGFNTYPLGGAVTGGYFPNRIANPGLRWERQREYNLGLDLGLFNNRITFSSEYFVRNNRDLLLNVTVPGITGFTSALRNVGEIQNQGVEMTLGLQQNFGKFNWNANLNFSLYRNKVLALGSEGEQLLQAVAGYSEQGSITTVGQPVGMFWGWIVDGVIRNEAELDAAPVFAPGTASATRVGDFRFRDIDGNGIINGDDRTIMGNPHPDYLFGINNTFSYAGFELNVSLQGVIGQQILQSERYFTSNMRGRHNHLAVFGDYWRSPEQPGNGLAPRAHNNPTGNNRAAWSTLHLDNGSFVRINNITLAYNLPLSLVQRYRLGGVRIYANATNAFTFTRYTGFNPDVSNSASALTPGIDQNNYPVARVLSLGLNLNF